MIVLDASAILELLLGTDAGLALASRIADPELSIHIPHLADVEVVQALRRYVRDGSIGRHEAEEALDDFRNLDLERHAHEPLLGRVWALRENLSAHDAVYVSLAEALDATLLTCDARLSRAPGMSRRVKLVE